MRIYRMYHAGRKYVYPYMSTHAGFSFVLWMCSMVDKWVSTLHRVILPNGPVARRQSMAFFVNVNGDTIIEPLSTCVTADHPAKPEYATPITARQHVMAKHLASMGHADN
jgi:isopenicillin N synthase-like dioxygenase